MQCFFDRTQAVSRTLCDAVFFSDRNRRYCIIIIDFVAYIKKTLSFESVFCLTDNLSAALFDYEECTHADSSKSNNCNYGNKSNRAVILFVVGLTFCAIVGLTCCFIVGLTCCAVIIGDYVGDGMKLNCIIESSLCSHK